MRGEQHFTGEDSTAESRKRVLGIEEQWQENSGKNKIESWSSQKAE